jgi:hypothetical protein
MQQLAELLKHRQLSYVITFIWHSGSRALLQSDTDLRLRLLFGVRQLKEQQCPFFFFVPISNTERQLSKRKTLNWPKAKPQDDGPNGHCVIHGLGSY